KDFSEDAYESMQVFHEQISTLDSNAAIAELNALIQKSQKSKNIAVAKGLKGVYLYQGNESNLDSAIYYLQNALQLSDQFQLEEWIAIFYNYHGFILIINKDYQQWVEHILFSDFLLTKIGYKKFYAAEIYLYHLSRIYFEFNKFN